MRCLERVHFSTLNKDRLTKSVPLASPPLHAAASRPATGRVDTAARHAQVATSRDFAGTPATALDAKVPPNMFSSQPASNSVRSPYHASLRASTAEEANMPSCESVTGSCSARWSEPERPPSGRSGSVESDEEDHWYIEEIASGQKSRGHLANASPPHDARDACEEEPRPPGEDTARSWPCASIIMDVGSDDGDDASSTSPLTSVRTPASPSNERPNDMNLGSEDRNLTAQWLRRLTSQTFLRARAATAGVPCLPQLTPLHSRANRAAFFAPLPIDSDGIGSSADVLKILGSSRPGTSPSTEHMRYMENAALHPRSSLVSSRSRPLSTTRTVAGAAGSPAHHHNQYGEGWTASACSPKSSTMQEMRSRRGSGILGPVEHASIHISACASPARDEAPLPPHTTPQGMLPSRSLSLFPSPYPYFEYYKLILTYLVSCSSHNHPSWLLE